MAQHGGVSVFLDGGTGDQDRRPSIEPEPVPLHFPLSIPSHRPSRDNEMGQGEPRRVILIDDEDEAPARSGVIIIDLC